MAGRCCSLFARTSDLVQKFGEWGKVYPDLAMTLAAVDRLVHHATIVEMNVDSDRRRAAIERKQQGAGRPAAYATIKNVGPLSPSDNQPPTRTSHPDRRATAPGGAPRGTAPAAAGEGAVAPRRTPRSPLGGSRHASRGLATSASQRRSWSLRSSKLRKLRARKKSWRM